jgi:hypothetical protein
MDGSDRLLVRGPGLPAGQQGIRTGDELRLQEQLREGRVDLVGAAVVQAHLGVAGQVELAGPIPVVDERDQGLPLDAIARAKPTMPAAAVKWVSPWLLNEVGVREAAEGRATSRSCRRRSR